MARRRQVPLVSTFHSKYYQDFYGKTKSKVIAQGVVNYIIRFYNQCDGVWTVNHATAQVLREYGYHGKIRIMENGTNREPLSPEGVAALNSRVRLTLCCCLWGSTITRRIFTAFWRPARC